MPTIDDARAATLAAGAFWQALAEDDDAAVAAVVTERAMAHVGGAGLGLAARFRDALSASVDACALMGTSNVVRVLGEDLLAVVHTVTRTGRPMILGLDGAELVSGHALAIARTRAAWRVTTPVVADTSMRGLPVLKVPVEYDSAGPIQ
jgi:hypothetical protein